MQLAPKLDHLAAQQNRRSVRPHPSEGRPLRTDLVERERSPRRAAIVGRLAGELAVIVLGVLLALAVDRWNQGRVDSALADEYHARLLAELVADSVRLEEHRVDASRRRSAGVQLFEAVRREVPDTIPRALFFDCGGSALPHGGGGTFSELQSTGLLRLLPSSSRQELFDYYGYVEGMRGRLQARRDRERADFNEAFARSGGQMPEEVISRVDFTERFRSYPNIEGIVMGCVMHQSAESGLVGQWVEQLAQVLSVIRQSPPG